MIFRQVRITNPPYVLSSDELQTDVGRNDIPTSAGKQRLLVAAIHPTYLNSDELQTDVGRNDIPTRAGKQRLLVAAIRPTY